MAIVKPVITTFSGDNANGDLTMSVVTWSPVKSGDTCLPVSLAHWADRSVQVDGDANNAFHSETIAIQGSNTNGNYYALRDPSLVNLSFTSAGLSQVLEITAYVKPVSTGGNASTSNTITMTCRRPQHLLQVGQ